MIDTNNTSYTFDLVLNLLIIHVTFFNTIDYFPLKTHNLGISSECIDLFDYQVRTGDL